VERLLTQLGRIDLILLLVGANDLNRRLGEDQDRVYDVNDPRVREELTARAFEIYPRRFDWFPPRRTATWSLADRLRRTIQVRRRWQMIQDLRGSNYQLWREQRAHASRIRAELPDLSRALAAYRSDLEIMLSLARRNSSRILFMTQPTLYRDDLPEAYEKLLWMGWVGVRQTDANQEYYSHSAMAEAYSRYNDTLRAFCRETGAECLDLDRLLPRDLSVFYDDLHLNESGAEKVALAIFDYLWSLPPFGDAKTPISESPAPNS
jgi:lysophospholipase L1-like esterase